MARGLAIPVLVLVLLSALAIAPMPASAAPAPFPGLKEIRTLGSADTGVSGVELVFNGTVDARRAHADYFTLTGCACLNVVIADNEAYDDRFTLRFQSLMPTSVTPHVAYDGTIGAAVDFPLRSPENANGEWAPGPDFSTGSSDRVPPGILDAVTLDRDGNGLLDAYRLTFTESVRDDTFILAQWAVAGTSVGPPIDDGAADDPSLTLPFAERAYLNTGAVPQLTYSLTGGNGLKDHSGNSLQDITPNRVFERDGVPAELLRLVPVKTAAGAYTNQVQAIFSEPVVHAGGGNPLVSDFVYDGGTGASSILSLSTTLGSSLVRLTLDAVVGAGDLGADTLNVKATCGNPAAACLQDKASPTPNLVAIGAAVTLLDDTQKPGAVQSLAATSSATTLATLSWTSPADLDLAHLELRMVPQGQNTDWSAMPFVANITGQPSTLQSFTLTGLTAFRSYEVAVRSVDASRNMGDDIVRTTFTTLAAPPPQTATSTTTATASTSASSTATSTDAITTASPPSSFKLQVPTHPGPRPTRDATITWTNATGDGPIVYRGFLSSSPQATVASTDPLVASPLQFTGLFEGLHYMHIAAFGPGGTTQAEPALIVVDTTPPGPLAGVAVTPAASRLQVDWTMPADAGTEATALVRHRTAAASGLAWEDFGNETTLPAAGGNVTGLLPVTNYSLALRARDAAGNLGPVTLLDATTLPDTTPPEGALALTALPRADGIAIGPSLSLGWEAATDPDSAVVYRYAFVQDDRELGEEDATTKEPTLALEDVAEGDWILLVRAESAGGPGATTRHAIPVRVLLPSDLDAAHGGIVVNVQRSGDGNHLTWTLPPLRVPPSGLQVWASNSPYILVHTLPASTGDFTHSGEAAKASTRYLVTAFYGQDPAHGWFEAPLAPSTTAYPGVAAPAEPLFSGWLLWSAVGLSVLLLAGAGTGAWWWLRRRKAALASPPPAAIGPEGAEDWAIVDDDAGADAPTADSRDVACYQCSTVYTEAGTLPLESTCPSCGAHGMVGG